MNRQHYLDTIETVLALDLPEEAIADAINHQFTTTFEEDDAWLSYASLSEYMH